jgi:predicted component of type VI protein secretion system
VAVRDKVEREWRFDQAQKVDKSLRKKLLASYEVIVKPDQRQQ